MVASVSSLLAWRRSFTPSFSPLSEVNGASAPTSNANNSSGEETEHGTPPKTFIQPFDIKPRARPAHRPFKQPVLKKLVPDQSTLPTLLRSPFFPQGQRKPRPVVDLLFDEDEDEDEDDDKYVDAKQNFVTQVVDDTSQKPAHHLDEAETSRPEEDAAVALELEKLRMHDKAIFPGSITKCEKIGSGGFKDVYALFGTCLALKTQY